MDSLEHDEAKESTSILVNEATGDTNIDNSSLNPDDTLTNGKNNFLNTSPNSNFVELTNRNDFDESKTSKVTYDTTIDNASLDSEDTFINGKNNLSKKSSNSDPLQSSSDEQDDSKTSNIFKILSGIGSALNELIHAPERKRKSKLTSFDFEGVANFIKEESPKDVIFMVGAGISTSAGIPDFRTPGTGLYDNLKKYNLSRPEAIFDIKFFKKNPEPFFALAKELFHENIRPTPSHYFMKLFEQKGILKRCYTQNIDMLEYEAGLNEHSIVTAHGSHHTSTCLSCRHKYNYSWMNERIRRKEGPIVPECEKLGCRGVVKPDIVFFGESLHQRFFTLMIEDFPKCDLLVIMGTSLVVEPFASLVKQVSMDTPRLLINKTPAGLSELRYYDERNTRDVFWSGDCDEGVMILARYLGWEDEMKALIASK